MPIFSDENKKVLRFIHRNILIEVFEAQMGATHCGLEHDPEALRCDICRHPIRPLRVYIAYCNDQQLDMVFHRVALTRIKNALEEYVDKILDFKDDDISDPFQDDDEIPPEGSAPIDGKRPKDPLAGLDDDSEPPKSSGSNSGPGQNPADKITKIAERAKKLGWANKAKLIIRELLEEATKPTS
ncbi:MAG: hypothetical protein WCT10_00115 [Patescibacteria group bacterium]|jgi:hypothetical protein